MAKKDKDKKSGGFGGFTSVRDMFDGGGAGRSGDTFQGGGLISAVGNVARVAPRGYHDNNSGGGSSQSQSRAAPAQRGRAVSDRGILDFFDGGGLGARGSSFQGLPISTIFNTMGMRPQGSQVANPQQQVGLYDYVDGGGFGQSGQAFQGSPYSMLANALGVNPMGYEERMAAARPQARSAAPAMGFGNDYSDMLKSQMGLLEQNPYEITPEATFSPTSGQTEVDGGFDNYVASLGGAADGMTPEARRYAYSLYLDGYLR